MLGPWLLPVWRSKKKLARCKTNSTMCSTHLLLLEVKWACICARKELRFIQDVCIVRNPGCCFLDECPCCSCLGFAEVQLSIATRNRLIPLRNMPRSEIFMNLRTSRRGLVIDSSRTVGSSGVCFSLVLSCGYPGVKQTKQLSTANWPEGASGDSNHGWKCRSPPGPTKT